MIPNNIILPDRELDTLRKVKRDALKWIKNEDHRVFDHGFETWMSRHNDQEKRELARNFMKMPIDVAKDTVNKLLLIFKNWELAKGEVNGKMGCAINDSSSDGERDPALPPVGPSGCEPSNGDGSPASQTTL